MGALPAQCGAVAEWSKALAWKVSIRQNRIEGSNPSRSATHRDEANSLKIGFLFNHDQIHQVAHSLPIAMALAKMNTGAEIVLAPTNARIQAEVERLAGEQLRSSLQLRPLHLKRASSKLLARLGARFAPAAKLLIYRDNLDFFRALDVLVVAEKTSLVLKSRFGLTQLKIVHTRHGAGDRAIGFDRASGGFDHVLVSGAKVRDRLIAEAGLDPGRLSVVGYPKFDLFAGEQPGDVSLDSGKPVVLYNPHVSPHLSSWYAMGGQVLDWFAGQDDYQLIFAPHVMLFERPLAISIDRLRIDRPGRIAERHRLAPNIHVDLGSRQSTTMAYLNRAEIYLGDVSSQVYEFLVRPRPCVFLNPHRFEWKGDPNFAAWTAGPVIERIAELGPALAEARAHQADTYAPIQQALFEQSFDLTDIASSVRAAEAIAGLAGLT
jgi:hypothetical protein